MSNLKNEPGIYHDVNPMDYFRLGTVQSDGTPIPKDSPDYIMSRSSLREFARCPKAWFLGRPEKDSRAFTWGTLIDILCLTPHLADELLVVQPETYSNAPKEGEYILTSAFDGEWNGRKKDCREWKAEQEAKGLKVLTPEQLESASEEKPWNNNSEFCKQWFANTPKGREVISAKMNQNGKRALEQIEKDLWFSHILRNSKKQTVIVWDWEPPLFGVKPVRCKAMIDIVPERTESSGALIDLKTTNDAGVPAWNSHVKKFGYHYQGAFYLDGWNSAANAVGLDDRRSVFAHLISESEAPYVTARRVLDEAFIEAGRLEYVGDLVKFAACREAGAWPGYSDDAEDGFEVTECPDYLYERASNQSMRAEDEARRILEGKEEAA